MTYDVCAEMFAEELPWVSAFCVQGLLGSFGHLYFFRFAQVATVTSADKSGGESPMKLVPGREDRVHLGICHFSVAGRTRVGLGVPTCS